MTKSEELSILDNAISKLGKDSYLGPWLTGVRSEVHDGMLSDIIPTASLKEYRDKITILRHDQANLTSCIRVKESELHDLQSRSEGIEAVIESQADKLRDALQRLT